MSETTINSLNVSPKIIHCLSQACRFVQTEPLFPTACEHVILGYPQLRNHQLLVLLFYTRAPDGSCILTNSADNVLRVYNLPPEIYSYNWDVLPEMVNIDIVTLPYKISCVMEESKKKTFLLNAVSYSTK